MERKKLFSKTISSINDYGEQITISLEILVTHKYTRVGHYFTSIRSRVITMQKKVVRVDLIRRYIVDRIRDKYFCVI